MSAGSGLNTPPFGPPDPYPTRIVTGYTAADFPAPAGVPPLPAGSANGRSTATHGRPNRRRGGVGLGALLATASLSAVVGAGAGIGAYTYADRAQATTVSPIGVTTVPAAQAPVLDGTVAAAAAKIQPSVVTIAVQSGRSGDIGTGIVLDASGHILTNDHVVAAAAQQGTITVTFHDGRSAQARIVGTSATNDLALLKVDGVDGLTPAVFARSSGLNVGQSVVAVGAPLGLSESVTSGIVSNTARPVRSGDDGDAVYLAVQTDAAINPGNSGGPLVDLNGAVIGINSSIATTGSNSSGSPSGNIGIGFAIPSDVVTRVAAELLARGSYQNAALGVTVGGSDSPLTVATGVTLQTVVSGQAAAKAGLQAGDQVTALNGFRTTTADGLIAATRFYAPGTTVTLRYLRDGRSASVRVTLGTA